ncbi:hypothetical protein AYI68_g8154 [Smittium mucronatum]|uniref:Uncharacterized protein n=1 Tax=Smittium mucronatum TaxID=133383 RepID=A0A1R0GLQ5_9FUNG|nr:hypothetical protein AYI68_g8154 [Smittium mucronatum]
MKKRERRKEKNHYPNYNKPLCRSTGCVYMEKGCNLSTEIPPDIASNAKIHPTVERWIRALAMSQCIHYDLAPTVSEIPPPPSGIPLRPPKIMEFSPLIPIKNSTTHYGVLYMYFEKCTT